MSKSSIEDFDVLSRLGSGSYGVVFKVRRRTDDKIYVIKTVRIVDLSVKEQQTAINEVTILSQLQSPFVVHYFDSFISGESLHLVMEYCNKGDLQGLIKKAKEKERTFLPEDLTWDMALQIILGDIYILIIFDRKVFRRASLKLAVPNFIIRLLWSVFFESRVEFIVRFIVFTCSRFDMLNSESCQ